MTDTDEVRRVREFYELLVQGRGDDVAAFVEANFAEDAVLRRPESLPGGGALVGASRIAKMMRAAAAGVSGMNLRSIHCAESADGVQVFADIALELAGTAVAALEWWTFTGSKVASLQAYYWDTAAILASATR
ncbi:hypothetical protein BOO86_15385 [Mycobacterium sp. CBMA 234]|uniref:nuclear transport factor 2 family protein n=1 Tax=Mycolicibacterium sp. CBMA 234 TaxID=1918495 RepID=UPI00139190E0|nr:nuclear transport factor 2 family protein [Mycolicibacterium sp. CBMA 234]MUL65857.1 hypothetical protein [Mycolicibacterium sp. CBMA 234]